MADILDYIDKMQIMYGDKEPSSMDQEPRNMYNQGSSVDHAVRTIDPVQDSGNKIEEVLKAYGRYRGSRKGKRPMKFKNFFELYATENFAEGGQAGQLVKPNDDGSRPGYMGKNVMSGSPAQQAENIRRQEESFKKISELFKNKDYTGLKLKTRTARIKAGTQKDTGGKLNSNQQGQIREAIEGGDETQKAFAKKLGITRKELLEGIEKSKSKITTELSEKMKKMRFTPDVQLQQKMFYEILENPDATVQSMAKKFKVSEKEITKKSSQLLKNVYTQNVAITKTPAFDIDSRGKATLKSWLPNEYESTKNFLNNFSDINGLKKVQTENMGILLANAYRDQPKKYAEAMKTLTAYNDFKNNLPKGMKVDLDHPLSKEFIKGSGASPDKLLYVSPVDRGFNRGFKKQIGDRYAKALLQFKKSGLPKDKVAIKNIRALAERVGVNIGDVKGSKLTFGTSKFDKNKNFALEYFKNLKEQNLVADNLKNLQKTKEGKQLIKDANFKKGQIKPIKKINKKQIQIVTNLVGELACPNTKLQLGGRVNFSNGSSCNVRGKKILDRIVATGKGTKEELSMAKKILNFGKGALSLKGLVGPQALVAEALLASGFVGYDVAAGKPLKEAIGNNLNAILGPKWKQDVEAMEFERLKGSGVNIDQLKQLSTAYKQADSLQSLYDKQYQLEMNKGNPGRFDRGNQKSRDQRLKEINMTINELNKPGGFNVQGNITETINDPNILFNKDLATDILSAQEAKKSILPNFSTAPIFDERRRREAMKAEGMLTIEDAKKELQDIGDSYGQGYTPFGLNKLFEKAGMQNPGYGITKVGPATGKYNQAQGLQDYLNSMRMQNIADAGGVANMAGGGIAGLSGGDKSGRPPESGPASQGLRSLFNNGKKQ